MPRMLQQVWSEQDGALSFEWCVIVTLLVFGIVGGLSAARDGLIDELSDVAAMVLHLDQSFSFAGVGDIPESLFDDAPGALVDCGRRAPGVRMDKSSRVPGRLPGQPAVDDVDS